jgi:hypothetical protein
MLARVRGRSPLEYLDKDERDRQAAAIVALMRDPPETVVGLASGFVAELSTVE